MSAARITALYPWIQIYPFLHTARIGPIAAELNEVHGDWHWRVSDRSVNLGGFFASGWHRDREEARRQASEAIGRARETQGLQLHCGRCSCTEPVMTHWNADDRYYCCEWDASVLNGHGWARCTPPLPVIRVE
jgi:hypothetical protein